MFKGPTQSKFSPIAHLPWRAVPGRALCLAALISTLLSACVAPPAPQTPFPDYGYKPPASEYSGTLFKLSQDYPTIRPPQSALPLLLNTDFTKNWRAYLMQARDYCFEGNIEADFRVENNKVRKWYHAPWQNYGIKGREGIHGLTKEAPLAVGQLAATQTYPKAVAYAVGIYNEFGGYEIGRVWQNHNDPDPTYVANEGFPVGTVVCKILFVSMPPEQVQAQIPFLVNPLNWQAYGYDYGKEPARLVQPMALIQMDVMVRDSRAEFGWVFGTFQYNGQLKNTNPWYNLVPVGLQWGNDPAIVGDIPVPDSTGKFPPAPLFYTTPINTKLKETYINTDSNLPPTHLGWGGRLAGPADNPGSSCFSCHMTASYPDQQLSGLFVPVKDRPSPTNTQVWDSWWMQWFQNNTWPKQFNPWPERLSAVTARNSLDFSLQMSDGIKNFYLSKQPTATPKP
jgi:hypothetical protein